MSNSEENWKQSAPDFGEVVNIVAAKRYLQALYAQVRPFSAEEVVSFYGNTLLIIQKQNEQRNEKLNATAIWVEELSAPIFYKVVNTIKKQFTKKLKPNQNLKDTRKSLSLEIILDLADTSTISEIASYFKDLKSRKSGDIIRTAELKVFKYFLSKSILPQQTAERALKRILEQILEYEESTSN